MDFLDRFWIGYLTGAVVTAYFWWSNSRRVSSIIEEAEKKADAVEKAIKEDEQKKYNSLGW